MTGKRAAVYIGGASLLAALASAAGVPKQSVDPPLPPTPVRTSGTETLAADVHAQTQRLRHRLESAPTPQQPLRNPFAFRPNGALASRKSAAPTAPRIPVVMPSDRVEPSLTLIGIAEQQSPKGIVRTALITSESGELFMLGEGQTLGATYRVTAIGADAVELIDLTTAAARRLALR